MADRFAEIGTNWQVKMFEAPCEVPGSFCYGCCCPMCFTCSQREEILELTNEPYICCAGLCPCGPLGQPQDKSCLYAEVCCCLGMSVAANRWMLQTRFLKINDPCDDCLILCNAALSCVACLCQLFNDDEGMVSLVMCIADVMNCCVMSCMLAQHQHEIAHIKEAQERPRVNEIMNLLPPSQQEMVGLKR